MKKKERTSEKNEEKRGGKRTDRKKAKKRSPLRFFRWGSPLPVLLLAALGVLLLCMPENSLPLLSVIVGAFFAGIAVLLISFAFTESKTGLISIAVGVALIAFAVWLFIRPEGALNALLIALTALLFLHGLFGLFYSLFAEKKQGVLWRGSLVGSIGLTVCAFVFFFLPVMTKDLRLWSLLLGLLACAGAVIETFALFHRFASRKGRNSEKEAAVPAPKEETERKTGAKKKKKLFSFPGKSEKSAEEEDGKEEESSSVENSCKSTDDVL